MQVLKDNSVRNQKNYINSEFPSKQKMITALYFRRHQVHYKF